MPADDDVRAEVCGGDALREGVLHPGQVCSDVHPLKQESAGKICDDLQLGHHRVLHYSDAEKEPSGKHSEHEPETGAPHRVDTSMGQLLPLKMVGVVWKSVRY